MPFIACQPLVDLGSAPESDVQGRNMSRHPPIQGPEGTFYGHEWARWRYDTLDRRVDTWLRAAPARVRVLELGCATGSRALAFARLGAEVTAIDVLDKLAELAERRAQLNCGPDVPGPGTLAFVQADLRTWSGDRDAVWDLIHMRRVINFMTAAEAGALFKRLQPCLARDGILVLSFVATGLPDSNQDSGAESVRMLPTLLSHNFSDIGQRLRHAGFEMTEIFSDGLCEAACIASRY